MNIIKLLTSHVSDRPQWLPGEGLFENIVAFNTNLFFTTKTLISSFYSCSIKNMTHPSLMLIKQEKFTPKIHSSLAFTPTQKVTKREHLRSFSPPSSEGEKFVFLSKSSAKNASRFVLHSTHSYAINKQTGNGFK